MALAQCYTAGDLEVRPGERRVLVGGLPSAIGARAFDLLIALIERRDRVVSKDELLALVWPGVVVEENNLTVQVSALRKVLGADALSTVAGHGYRFTLPLHEGAEVRPPAPMPSQLEPPLAPADRPSIAVLPFDVLAQDSRMRFLADGLVEDVIALLARVPGFLLISRSSSFEFRQRDEGIAAIARALGVRYIVEGSVRPVGAQVRASTQLVQAESGRVLWSGRIEGSLDDASDLQEAIARGIIAELEPELTRAEIALIHRRRPENVDAWGHYHRAVGAIASQGWTDEALRDARAAMLAAIAVDPDFSLARAHFAVITALGANTGVIEASPAVYAESRAAAERALAQDDASPQVLGLAGCALCDLGEVERGSEIIERALAIDPSNAQAHVGLGAAMALRGDWQAGIERMRDGMRISPRDRRLGFWGWFVGLVLLRAGHPDQALQEARASAARDPRLHLARVLQALALQALGRSAEAHEALDTARRLYPQLTPQQVTQSHGRRLCSQLDVLWHAKR